MEVQLQRDNIRVIISGGGSGGHIFPAIAIANALKRANDKIEILFVGAIGKMEMEKVPAAGYNIEGLWISGLQRKLTLKNLLFPFKVISSVMKSYSLINKFKPNVAVGVGGFASGPLLYAASRKGIPTLIQEQNSYPGITNKMLSKRANKICVAYSGMEKYFPKDRIIITGNPVRKDIKQLEGKKSEALKFFNLSENKKTVLVVGGSLGARTINESISAGVEELVNKGLQVVWQTGKQYFPSASEQSKKYWESVKAFDFISKMDYAYAVADIVVSRAGAISISELAVAGKPCILIPSPNVAEDHQTKNAMEMVSKNAAMLVKDSEAKSTLNGEILKLISDNSKTESLRKNIAAFAKVNADEEIANEVMKLIKSY